MGETLEREQAPTRHRLDVDAYYKMAEAGILTQSDRVELIEGEIFDMFPTGDQPPTRHRLDVYAYYKMAEAGVLGQDDRVELIGGEIFDRVPIGAGHGGKTNRLIRLFAHAAADGLVLVSVQSPLRLDPYNEPEPDLMLLKPRKDDYQESHPNAADVLLLVEVSDTSLAYDRGSKLSLYAKFGVPEVWIVDLRGAAIEIYRDPVGDRYARKERLVSGSIAPALVPGAAIDVAALFA